MINKAHLVECYTNKERTEGKCQGIFYENINGSYKLTLEFDAITERKIFEIYRKYDMSNDIINFCCNDGDFFVFEYVISSVGSRVRDNICKLLIEIKVYKFGVGMNCFNLLELKIEQASCDFYNLDKWINGISRQQIKYEEHVSEMAKGLVSPAIENREYKITDNFKINLFIATQSLSLSGVKEQYNFNFIIKNGVINDYNDKIIKFTQLMTILCRSPIEIKDITLSLNEKTHITIKGHKWIDEKEVATEQIISYNDLIPNFEKIIKGYYQMMSDDNKKLSIQTLVSNIHETKTVAQAESDFLAVCKAIENIYEGLLSETKTNITEESEDLIKTIINTCSATLSKKQIEELENKLDIAYSVTFRKKLKAFLLDSVDYLPKNCDEKQQINSIVNTRNFYTHLGNNKGVIGEDKLFTVSLVLYSWLVFRLIKYWNNEEKVIIKQSWYNYIQVDKIIKTKGKANE